MKYILIIALTHTHWFSGNTHTFTTQEFDSQTTCQQVMKELNIEAINYDPNIHAECVPK